jgi:hypothetical protein
MKQEGREAERQGQRHGDGEEDRRRRDGETETDRQTDSGSKREIHKEEVARERQRADIRRPA